MSTNSRTYDVGDRVLYTQPTSIHKGALPHGAKCGATVITAFGGGEDSLQRPTYQLRLDECWGSRFPSLADEQIIVGLITENHLSVLKKKSAKKPSN